MDLFELFNEFYRILKPNGTLIMFYDIWKMGEVKKIAEEIGFKQPRLCCWHKTNPVPINSKINYLSNCNEYFITFVKKSKPTFNSLYDSGEYFCNEESDTFYYPILHGKERLKHPTQKPLSLIKQLIEKHTNEGDWILDCFSGSGTTGQASDELNRNCVMCELNEIYYNMAIKRIGREKFRFE